MTKWIHHLFVPHELNNHRAGLLAHKSIFYFILLFFIGQFAFQITTKHFSDILGTSTNISSQVMLLLINQDRQTYKLLPLALNENLSQAALLKAQDMLDRNYWAHSAPDGTNPWVFIQKAGYKYTYAGENLARGFTKSEDVVRAWMKSPTHRTNILSPNYQDVGFAVVEGKLLGERTTLIVEMFGGKNTAAIAKQENPSTLAQQPFSQLQSSTLSFQTESLIHSPFLTRTISLLILAIFIFALILDMIIIERKKIIRFLGHNLDHTIFLGAILIFVVVFSKGAVL